MQKVNRLLSWPLVLLFLFCSTALAAPDVPTPDSDAASWIKALYTALTSKEWTIVVGLAMVGLVYPLRKWAAMIVPWFKTPFGGLVLGFMIALATTLGTAAAAGASMSLALVATSLSTAAAAAGIWEWVKTHLLKSKSAGG